MFNIESFLWKTVIKHVKNIYQEPCLDDLPVNSNDMVFCSGYHSVFASLYQGKFQVTSSGTVPYSYKEGLEEHRDNFTIDNEITLFVIYLIVNGIPMVSGE